MRGNCHLKKNTNNWEIKGQIRQKCLKSFLIYKYAKSQRKIVKDTNLYLKKVESNFGQQTKRCSMEIFKKTHSRGFENITRAPWGRDSENCYLRSKVGMHNTPLPNTLSTVTCSLRMQEHSHDIMPNRLSGSPIRQWSHNPSIVDCVYIYTTYRAIL